MRAKEWVEMDGDKEPLRELDARMSADGVGARDGWEKGAAGDERAWMNWVEMGGNKEPLEMGELGCAKCGRRGSKGLGRNGWKKEPLWMSKLRYADGRMACCGRGGCK
eukprot:s818_g2.t1